MSKYNEFMIARMAVLGCHRNPQARTIEECCKCDFKQGMCDAYRMAEDLYENGFKPVVHAHWIKCADGEFECSHCKGKAFASPSVSVEKVTNSYKYCFECGAKMDEEVKE